jgi:NADPH-dependent ferric siderophore reductase
MTPARAGQDRTGRRLRRTTVAAVHRVTPRIIRLTVAGDLEDFPDQGTDQHVALYFYPPEAIVPEDLDPEALRALHEFAFPQVRRYTIRQFRPDRAEADIDVVVHEPAGLAAGWADGAQVGDQLLWWGPTAAWTVPEGTRTLVMIGDESGMPAIEATLRDLDPSIRALVVAEVADEREEAYLAEVADRAHCVFVHRGGGQAVGDPEAIERAVRELLVTGPMDTRDLSVWVGSEFASAGAMRRLFLGEYGMTKERAFIVSYWIHGQPQDRRPDERMRAQNLRRRAQAPREAARFLRRGWEDLSGSTPRE